MKLLKRISRRVELESRIALPIKRKLPDFLIIGTQKGGTTSLYDYLTQHPKIKSAFTKEVHFFDNNYEKGLEWYKSFFPRVNSTGLTGESSPYYLYHSLVPKRVKTHLEDVKLIVCLRNPVQRAFSHYKMEKRRGIEKLSFSAALKKEGSRLELSKEKIKLGEFCFEHQYYSYMDRGMYAIQLERWFQLFPKEQILIINSDSLFTEPKLTYNKVLNFLGIGAYNKVSFKPLNTDISRQEIPKDVRNYLTELYKPHNENLYNLVGEEYSW